MHKGLFAFIFFISPFVFAASSLDSAPKTRKSLSEGVQVKIEDSELEFEYVSEDGTYWLNCAHWQRDNTLPDWDVICGKGTDYVRQFHVVFWVRTHQRSKQPQTLLESVYYVTDRNSKPIRFTSHSNWIELSKSTDVNYLKYYQGVENDYASLTVTYRPQKLLQKKK